MAPSYYSLCDSSLSCNEMTTKLAARLLSVIAFCVRSFTVKRSTRSSLNAARQRRRRANCALSSDNNKDDDDDDEKSAYQPNGVRCLRALVCLLVKSATHKHKHEIHTKFSAAINANESVHSLNTHTHTHIQTNIASILTQVLRPKASESFVGEANVCVCVCSCSSYTFDASSMARARKQQQQQHLICVCTESALLAIIAPDDTRYFRVCVRLADGQLAPAAEQQKHEKERERERC